MSCFLLRAFRRILVTGSVISAFAANAQAQEPLASASEAFAVAPVSITELDASRGGSSFDPGALNYSSAALSAQSSQNVVIGGFTGANAITNSFNGSQGLVNVIQNSGNNVIIQSSTIVNLSLSK